MLVLLMLRSDRHPCCLQPPGLSVSGLKDALQRLAAVMLNKVADKVSLVLLVWR